MSETIVNLKLTGVKAKLLTELRFHAEPGDMMRTVNDAGEIIGFMLACPGCGSWGGIQFVADEHFKNPWRVTGGSVNDVTTLTVRNSILVHCCGWHGYLNKGVFELNPRDDA
jgi:hypothetical protein